MSLQTDLRDLLAAFAAHEVAYLIVGGYAVAFHGEPRFTKDLALWIDDTEGNLSRARQALTAFGVTEDVLVALAEASPSIAQRREGHLEGRSAGGERARDGAGGHTMTLVREVGFVTPPKRSIPCAPTLEFPRGLPYDRDVGSDFEVIFRALADAGVRYLTVGGVAVVLHGVPRFTADLDLVIELERDNLHRALGALASLGYRPRAPVALEDFADAAKRASWIATKGLTVLSLWSPRHPATEVDLFVQHPFVFADAYARALRADLGESAAWVVSRDDLVAMKKQAGRPKDLEDVRALSLGADRADPTSETDDG
ncbi:MAG: hypothetical protein IT385_23235 [Deltaproteobacteria bacterium]|nr:hypothetical protein [Deltaproteobacteria bacterium]